MSKRATLSPPRRVHRHAFERLLRIYNEIRRGKYPNKSRLAELIERGMRTVQRDLGALVDDYGAPLEFDRSRNGFYFTDPEWRFPAVAMSEGELLAFFAAELLLRRGPIEALVGEAWAISQSPVERFRSSLISGRMTSLRR